jgi:hypothetical protein
MTLALSNQLARASAKGRGQPVKIRERDIALSALDSADVIAMEAGAVCQRLLGVAAIEPSPAHCVPERSMGRRQHARRLSPRAREVYTLRV